MKTDIMKTLLFCAILFAASLLCLDRARAEERNRAYATKVSGSLTNSMIVTTNSVWLDYAFITNHGPAQEILFFDSKTNQLDGAVAPIFCLMMQSGESKAIDFDGYPVQSGVSICNSTTTANPFLKAIGAADCFFLVRYHQP